MITVLDWLSAQHKRYIVLLALFLTILPEVIRADGAYAHHGNITTVCFHDNDAAERGATLAMYDYADFLEKLYPGRFISKIILPRRKMDSAPAVAASRFEARFPVSYYTVKKKTGAAAGGKAMPDEAIKAGCSILYMIKSGSMKSVPSYPESFDCSLPTAVHGVFSFGKHGTTYAVINQAMTGSDKSPNDAWKRDLVVPHIVRPPVPAIVESVSDLRATLNISKSALVFCRTGGKDTFDIKFVKEEVRAAARKYPKDKLHFVFLNTVEFIDRDDALRRASKGGGGRGNVHFMKSTVDDRKKESFFKTCDVFLHARKDGETFGLAVAEFSVRNKPVVTYGEVDDPTCRNHIDVLGSQAYVYNNSLDLRRVISSFVENGVPKNKRFDAFKKFNPTDVMKRFVEVFLQPIMENKLNKYHMLRRC